MSFTTMRRAVILGITFMLGWQIGVFACTCINPGNPDVGQDCCQAPHCHDYSHECPSGWIKFSPSGPYPCCRTYTGSSGIYNDPPCCEWIIPYQPGCAHFGCFKPPNGPMVTHCKRWNTTRRGNWKEMDIWICEGETGGGGRCNEKVGRCKQLE